MPEPTKGPWRVFQSRAGRIWSILNGDGHIIASTIGSEANAHRMAAAPEMLEALEWAHVQLCPHPQWCESNHPVLKPRHDTIRAAIAKARGG